MRSWYRIIFAAGGVLLVSTFFWTERYPNIVTGSTSPETKTAKPHTHNLHKKLDEEIVCENGNASVPLCSRQNVTIEVSRSTPLETKTANKKLDTEIVCENGNASALPCSRQNGTIEVSRSTPLETKTAYKKLDEEIVCESGNAPVPLCHSNSNMTGEWVFVQNKTFLNPICCSWDTPKMNGPNCTNARKLNTTQYTGHDHLHQPAGGHSCSCTHFKDDYVWKSPDLPEFSPQETCRLLGSRKVLLTGDSTIQQTGTTLMNVLIPGGCQTQVTVGLSDHLVAANEDRGTPWKSQIETLKPDIAIMTMGAHQHKDSYYYDVLHGILKDIAEARKKHPNMTIVWKTQNPAGCSPDIRYPQDPMTAGATQTFSYQKTFQHAKFYNRDLYAITQMQEHGVPILDMRMLYSRSDAHACSLPDQHNDCLHFCIPGPLEVIAPLFQNLLAKLPSTSSSSLDDHATG